MDDDTTTADRYCRLLRSLRLWRAVALLLAVALVVAVVVNRRQAAGFRETVLMMAEAEVRVDEGYRQIIEEVRRAFSIRSGDEQIVTDSTDPIKELQRIRLETGNEVGADEAIP